MQLVGNKKEEEEINGKIDFHFKQIHYLLENWIRNGNRGKSIKNRYSLFPFWNECAVENSKFPRFCKWNACVSVYMNTIKHLTHINDRIGVNYSNSFTEIAFKRWAMFQTIEQIYNSYQLHNFFIEILIPQADMFSTNFRCECEN